MTGVIDCKNEARGEFGSQSHVVERHLLQGEFRALQSSYLGAGPETQDVAVIGRLSPEIRR